MKVASLVTVKVVAWADVTVFELDVTKAAPLESYLVAKLGFLLAPPMEIKSELMRAAKKVPCWVELKAGLMAVL